jgi:hypothetical protein
MPPVSKTLLGVAISLSVFVLTACSAEADSPQPGVPATAGEGTGILETTAGSYVFTPSTCAIYKEDGVDDIEIQGPGTAPDGEKFFFELSSTGNAITIGFGVDGPFASPERQLKAGIYASQEFTIVVADRKISVSGLVLVDENGGPVEGDATLKIDCRA